MSRDDEVRSADAVAEDAARWFVRLRKEAATGEDWLAFEAWLAAAPAHAAAYDRLESAWVALEDVDPAVLEPSGDLAAARRHRAGVSRRAWLAAGAGLAASVAVGVVGYQAWPERAAAQTYRTALGETREIVLADGSHVHLNADSSLRVTLKRRERRVEMAEGEAAFDVAHDPGRPFLIRVGDREVRVVGTEFNLRHRSGAIALTVRRGIVEVRPADDPTAPATRVVRGQRLTHRRGAAVSTLTTAEPDAAFGWTRGQLVYEAAPLSEVAADLSRSLGTPIRPADAATGALRFSGVLVVDRPDAVLRRTGSARD